MIFSHEYHQSKQILTNYDEYLTFFNNDFIIDRIFSNLDFKCVIIGALILLGYPLMPILI